MPVRDRYKVFIIDEVHQLSTPSFNALLKSIEEPPPHVVFMMATTELEKIPETVLSRSQVYEFRTIGTKAIAEQLRRSSTPRASGRRRFAAAHRARRRGQHARRAEQARSGDRLHRRRTIGQTTSRRCSGSWAAICCSTRCRRWPTRTRRRRSRSPAARSRWATTCALVCRELSRVVRDLLVLSVDPVAGQRSGDRRRRGARAADGAGGAVLARRPAARVRPADAGGGGHPRRRAAALSPRDGAAAVDLPAQAGADRGSDRRRGAGRVVAPVAQRRAASRTSRPPPRRPAAAVRALPHARPVPRPRPTAGRPAPAAPPRVRERPSRRPPAAGRPRRRATSRTRCSREIEGTKAGVLQHGRRAGADDRGRRRSRDVHASRGAGHAARHVRAASAWLEALAQQVAGRE